MVCSAPSANTLSAGSINVCTSGIGVFNMLICIITPCSTADRQDGEEILPVLWSDNYFALLPGETREVNATYSARDLGRSAPTVEVDGWNYNGRK